MDPILGEIRLMAFTYAPRGWALCQGQILPIQQNTALFALLGTQYGGNGTTTFALPDLRGRTHIGAGQGPGLSSYRQGQASGTETVALNATQIPFHTHTVPATTMPVSATASTNAPSGAYFAPTAQSQYAYDAGGNMAADSVSGTATQAGNGAPHENLMPYLVLEYCIATQGIFPQRS
jgi:microcystin-dependent protein